MDHQKHVTNVLRGIVQTLMTPRPEVTPEVARQRVAYLADDVARGRVEPMRHDAEELAAAMVLRLNAWQFPGLTEPVRAAYQEVRELTTEARLIMLAVAVDDLARPHRGDAELAAVARALAVVASLVPPECYRADTEVDAALRGGA